MSYRQVTETLNRVARQMRDDMAIASSYIKQNGIHAELDKFKTDGRDLAPLVALWGINSKTPEDRAEEIKDKIEWLRAAFKDPNREVRKPYLDMIFDTFDSMDPAKVDMNNEADVRKLLVCMLMNQTYPVKRRENIDYFNARYPTMQQEHLANMNTEYIAKAIGYIKKNLENTVDENGIALMPNPGMTISTGAKDIEPEVYDCTTAFAKTLRDDARAEREGQKPSNVYEVPVIDQMLRTVGNKLTKIPKYNQGDQKVLRNYSGFIFDPVLARQSKKMEGLMEANLIGDMAAVFVDGMPFEEFLQQQFPDPKKRDKLENTYQGDLKFNLLTNLILNPDHQVDIVHPYRGEDGQMKYEPKTLKPVVTPEQEERYMQQFTWIRRFLSERGYFRIEPLREKLARAVTDPEDPNVKERYEKICANLKERVETGIEAIRQEKERERQKELANVHTYDKEKELMARMVSMTVANYSRPELKTGAMLVMSNMMEKSCEELMDKLKESPTFESVAEILAKQVLFGQLVTVRTTTQHKIGALENALIGDTDAATKAKIDIAVKIIAQDPALKENFFKMAGVADGENPVVDKAFMDKVYAAGGYRTLTKSYTAQKAAENAQNMIIEGIQNQMSIQQQAPTNAPANAQPPQPTAPENPQSKPPEQAPIGIG